MFVSVYTHIQYLRSCVQPSNAPPIALAHTQCIMINVTHAFTPPCSTLFLCLMTPYCLPCAKQHLALFAHHIFNFFALSLSM